MSILFMIMSLVPWLIAILFLLSLWITSIVFAILDTKIHNKLLKLELGMGALELDKLNDES